MLVADFRGGDGVEADDGLDAWQRVAQIERRIERFNSIDDQDADVAARDERSEFAGSGFGVKSGGNRAGRLDREVADQPFRGGRGQNAGGLVGFQAECCETRGAIGDSARERRAVRFVPDAETLRAQHGARGFGKRAGEDEARQARAVRCDLTHFHRRIHDVALARSRLPRPRESSAWTPRYDSRISFEFINASLVSCMTTRPTSRT